MHAVHSNWSKPRIYSCGHFFLDDFDILTTILSALKWREKNGTITMITDRTCFEFYSSRGMECIWDEITTELDDIPATINPEVFWAAGKIFALAKISAPAAVIDTDFIVWDRLAFNKLGDITVIHSENISENIYPDMRSFKMKNGYSFEPALDWTRPPSNTAFYVIKNDRLRSEYTSAAIEFMNCADGSDKLIYMVFAEQRLLSMTAKKTGISLDTFSNLPRLFQNGDHCFTHTWGMKQQMRNDNGLRHDFCRRCIKRITSDFPEYKDMLGSIPELDIYLQQK